MFGIRFTFALFRNKGWRRRKPARYRPTIQALEDRCLLSTFQEFPLPDLVRNPTDEFHRERITTGPDGNLWFIDGVYGFGSSSSMHVGRMAPDGSVTEFPIEDHTITQLYNIMAGPDGNLWMLAIRTPIGTNDDHLIVIRMSPDGDYTVFDAFPGRTSSEDFVGSLSPLVVGPDGNLWYTASFYTQFPGTSGGSIVGRITPAGEVTNFNPGVLFVELASGGLTAGADGNLLAGFAGVRRISPHGQASDPIPGSHELSQMVTDANGNVWGLGQTGPTGGVIERIAPDGTVSDFSLPAGEPRPRIEPVLDPLRMTLTAGPDGNIWFSDPYANQIGNITPDGTVTEYAVPTPGSFPAGITTGPDGNIWFTEMGSGQIGEFVLNDPGTAARSAPKAQGPLAVNAAAVEALFASAEPHQVNGAVSSQPPTAASIDVVFAVRPSAALTVPTGSQVRAAAGSLTHLHKGDPAVAVDLAGLADPLTEAL
jgi:hypothetical protein